jgi:hypothetical protein
MRASIVLLAAAVVICTTPSCEQGPRKLNLNPINDQRAIGISKSGYTYVVQYGYMDDKLAFVAFTGRREPNDGVAALVTMGSHETILETPDGKKVVLPSAVQLYEVIDSHYRESKERVAKEEFEAFMHSEPKAYTINSLLSFVTDRRGQQHKE